MAVGLERDVPSDLSGCAIDDESLDSLSGLVNLQWLFLGDTMITDQGLDRLRGLSKLTMFSAYGIQVTKEAKQKFSSVANWGAFGLCWGGKVRSCSDCICVT